MADPVVLVASQLTPIMITGEPTKCIAQNSIYKLSSTAGSIRRHDPKPPPTGHRQTSVEHIQGGLAAMLEYLDGTPQIMLNRGGAARSGPASSGSLDGLRALNQFD
jgi:hypothetical protein